MDLVNIGYVIKADGIKQANKEIDQLLTKVENLDGKKITLDTENVTKAQKATQAQVDRTSKALERQTIVGDYLGKGLDKTTANALANFKLLGASTKELDSMYSLLGNNKGLVEVQKGLEQLERQQKKVYEQGAKEYQKYVDLSSKSFGGGILAPEKANKEMEALKKHYAQQEAAALKHNDKIISLAQSRSDKQLQILKKEQDRVRQEMLKNQFMSQGYSKTQAGQLSSFQMGTTNPKAMQDFKRSIDDANSSLNNYTPSLVKATQAQKGLFDSQAAGIVKYAVMSAAIYTVMSSITSLIGATVSLADEYTSIQNRMKLYVKDAETLKIVNSDLARMSVENNVGLRETSTLYSRLAPSMQKFGADTRQITAVVDAFGKSMRIGGATAMEAASATIQFSQAMASGKLQGDEFRSISEASPRFLRAIAEGAGIAADKLKQMSSEGALTTELITKALIKEYPKLIEENMKLGMTLEQGVNAIKTGFGAMVGQFNEGAKLTESVGTAFASMATSFFKAAEGATQAGSNFRETLSTIGTVLKAVGTALVVAAIAMTSKFIVGLVQGVVGLVQYNRQMLLTIANLQRSTTDTVLWSVAIDKATQSLARMRAMQSAAMSAMGGWPGIVLTLAGVAAAFLMTRDNAEAVNSKLAEQTSAVYRTAEEWAKLNAEQRKNAEFKLTTNAEEASKQVEKLHNEYVKMFEVMATGYGHVKTPETLELIEKVKQGTIDYTSALREAQKLVIVSPRSLKQFMELESTYNTAAESLNKIRESGKNAGIEIKDVGNKAQNAEVGVSSMDSAMVALGFSSEETARKLQDVKRSFIDMAADIQTSLNLQINLGIDQGLADKAVKSVNEITAAQQAGIDSLKKDVEDQTAAISKMASGSAKTILENQLAATKQALSSSITTLQAGLDATKQGMYQTMSPELKQVQAMQDKQSAYTKSLKPQKAPKKTPTEKASAQFTKQLAEMYEYNKLLTQGHEVEVAKVAAQEKYRLVFGDNLATAKKIYEYTKDTSALEAKAALDQQGKDHGLVKRLMDLQIPKDIAEQTISVGFKVDEDGFTHAQGLIFQAARDIVAENKSSADEQSRINQYLAVGVDLEKAKVLSLGQQKIMQTELGKQAVDTALVEIQRVKVEQARATALQEINKLNYESLIYAQNYSEQMTQLLIANKDLAHSDITRLAAAQSMRDILKEHSEEMEKQKSFAGVLESIDFSVFESLGDPFKTALTSLDEMVFGVDKLGEKYSKVYTTLNEDMQKHAGDESKLANLKSQYASVQASEEREISKMRNKGITQALGFTKSLFNEDSKAYKNIAKLEKLHQASQIAFALWEKREAITSTALKLANKAKEIVMSQAANAVAGVAAVLEQAKGDPYTAFARMAAMVAVVAGLGVMIKGGMTGGGNKGSHTSYNNTGQGTSFGDAEAVSKSMTSSMEHLKKNSELLLPLTSAMLRSLRNIENGIGGVANLLIRGDVAGKLASQFGFDETLTGVGAAFDKLTQKVTSGMTFVLTGGLNKLLGANSIANALGGLVGGITNKLIGGLFGKTSQTVSAQGLIGWSQSLAAVLDKGFAMSEYADVTTTKKSWFKKSTSQSTQFNQASQEISDQFTLIFSSVFDSVLSATTALGADAKAIEKKLLTYVLDIGKIDLKGKSGSEIQALLEGVIGAEADKISMFAFSELKSFQRVGEGYYETLVRVATGVEKATYMTQWLNVEMVKWQDIMDTQGDVTGEIIKQSVILAYQGEKVSGGFVDLIASMSGTGEEVFQFVQTLRTLQDAIIATGKDGDYLTSSMILGAGGADKLASGLNAYYEMLSPIEQAAELTRRLTNEFAIYGQELPVGIKGYRDLINSIDISTEAGQKLYGQLISLAGGFTTMQNMLDKVEQERLAEEKRLADERAAREKELQRIAEQAAKEVERLVKSLRDLAEQARATRGESEGGRNLEYLRSEYERAARMASYGDKDAIEQMLSLGKDLMNVSKEYSKTYEDYIRDLALIQSTADGLADRIEGGSVTPKDDSSIPLPSLNTTSVGSTGTLSTSSKATDEQISQMRDDMVIAMTTVAKYIQRLDAKFDRWDDGAAMNVRPIQEIGDTPLKVQTVE